jgi:hypothetical protein
MSNVYFHESSEDTAEAVFFHAPNRKPQSTNPLKESTMSELEQAIIDGEYEIMVIEIHNEMVKYILTSEGTEHEFTPESPEFQMIHNAIVDSTGLLRVDLDIVLHRRTLTRENIGDYSRAVLLNPVIAHRGYENRMVLIERAIRIVSSQTREDMAGIPF